jgi:hypothetical protein
MDNYDLFRELGIAMNRNPDLTVLGVIELVLERQFPTRKSNVWDPYWNRTPNAGWEPTNGDILKALRAYNEG